MGADFSQSDGPISSINVTPFVDVALVLLVIFMVTAPTYLKDSLNVQLPKATATDGKVADVLGIAITRGGQILLNGQITTENGLQEAVREMIRQNPQAKAILAADIDARHGDVVRVIDLLKTQGLNRFAFQIQSPQQ